MTRCRTELHQAVGPPGTRPPTTGTSPCDEDRRSPVLKARSARQKPNSQALFHSSPASYHSILASSFSHTPVLCTIRTIIMKSTQSSSSNDQAFNERGYLDPASFHCHQLRMCLQVPVYLSPGFPRDEDPWCTVTLYVPLMVFFRQSMNLINACQPRTLIELATFLMGPVTDSSTRQTIF